ncbi:MAG: hypothetical protein V1728_00795 [Candidatus Micrarchaeota archaeon]
MKEAPLGKEFAFKMPNGALIGRARNLTDLCNFIKTAPLEAVLYHANGQHFGPWLEFIGERAAAANLKGLVVNARTVRVALLRALRA